MTLERYRELQGILEREGFIEFEDYDEAQEFAELEWSRPDARVIASTTRKPDTLH
jgi:hypothetical protein